MEYRKDFVKSDGRRLLKGGPRDQQLRAKAASENSVMDALLSQITDLKSEIKRLETTKGSGEQTPSKKSYFTPEQVDEEIRKAVSQAMAEATISLKKSGADPNVEKLIKTYKQQIIDLQRSNDDFVRMHSAITNENKELKEKLDILKEQTKNTDELKNKIALLEQTIAGKDEVIETLKTRPAIIGVDTPVIEDPDRPKMEQVFIDPLEQGAGEGLKSSITSREISHKDDGSVMEDKVNKLKNLLGNKLPKNI